MFDTEKFLPLKSMAAFTEEMFNNILQFQEKQHPAWDEKLAFVERIQKLPLHYLVFSNGDRDTSKHDCTVAHFYPLRWEMNKIAWYITQVEKEAKVLDVHGGNGFIGSLLGREGVKVTGIREPDAKPNQIENFFDAECYTPWQGKLVEYGAAFDVALSSWMPSGTNYTPDIIKKAPKVLVFIFTEHEHDGVPQTGCKEAYDLQSYDYQLVDSWTQHRPENLFHDIWPDLTPNPAEDRRVSIYIRSDVEKPKKFHAGQEIMPYFWERELHMALLALEGKRLLLNQGYQLE